jgi:hypothetical protein
MTTSSALAEIERLHHGFRARYLLHAEIKSQLEAWARAFPEVARLETIGTSVDGREIFVLTLGRDADRPRPAVWVDGNMHAVEVSGSSVSLAIAEDVLRAHVAPDANPHDLPLGLRALIQADVLFYVCPRISPDGAEHVLTTGAYVRSNPRDDRDLAHARWKAGDVDGDGQARLMRKLDPTGDFVASAVVENLLVPRTVEDEGPFYALYPEGTIADFDGFSIPHAGDFLADNATDMNRNFPFDWKPEPHQAGAGAYPASEPEARAVTEFALAHPNIFAWLNLHTFGGCWIRPSGDLPDKKMNQRDLAVLRQIEVWSDAFTGYPMVSGFEEFTYEPDKPLAGDLQAFAYEQRGAIALVCELWDFFKQVGLDVKRPFVTNYDRFKRAEVEAMGVWDRDHNRSRVVGAWRPFEHPQIGAVEIGGYDPRFGVWNPPPERIGELCTNVARVLLRMAAMAPRVAIAKHLVERLGDDLHRVTVEIENQGYLPTFVLDSARTMPHGREPRVRLRTALRIEAGELDQGIGHLEGWGGTDRSQSMVFARTSRGPSRHRVVWVVRGRGEVTIEVASPRIGRVEAKLEVG